LKRARQTAGLLSKETSIKIDFRDELMEFNNGLLAGLSREEAERKYPRNPDLPVNKSVYEISGNCVSRRYYGANGSGRC
jgi:2,3-bisphosphoglycerate-dependent phosphoglycerate mutase